MYPLLSSDQSPVADPTVRPVFIVGPPRSGSSFLVEALFNAGFGGSSEGHFFPLLAELDALVEGYYGQARAMGLLAIPENTIAKVAEATVRDELAALFERLHTGTLSNASRWLDKTVRVEAIGALPFLLARWPGAKVLYLTRHGVDNVLSAERYFDVAFDVACRNWVFCSDEWDRTRPLLNAASWLRLDHDELTRAPAATSRRLAAFLELSPAQAADFEAFVVARTRSWNAGREERPSLDRLDWAPERLAAFLAICGAQMVSQGYIDQAEIDRLAARVRPGQTCLTYAEARVLSIDDTRYFQRAGDGWFIVPGRSRASMLVFEQIDVTSKARLVGQVAIAHPSAQPVRIELLVITADRGHVILAETVELNTTEPVDLSLALTQPARLVDCIVRVTLGSGAQTNDHAWVRMERLAFVA
jgi:hypothetical protein